MSSQRFPLSAIVGHDVARRAFLTALVDPNVRGLLIIAPVGAGKSFFIDAALGFASVTTSRVPVGAPLEDLEGSIDLAQTLRSARVVRRAGLLERSREGWLVADDVELLDPAVAAALSRHLDEGGRLLATTTAAGDVPAALRDRLDVHVTLAPGDREDALERLRRRWIEDRDPGTFASRWQPAEDTLRDAVTRARSRLNEVTVSDEFLHRFHERALHLGLSGARAPLAAWRVARAHAAISGATNVGDTDAEFAEAVVYFPRVPGDPEASSSTPQRSRPSRDPASFKNDEKPETNNSTDAESSRRDQGEGSHAGEDSSPQVLPPEPSVAPDLATWLRLRRRFGPGGRRGRVPSWERGRPTRTVAARGRRGRLALVPTLRQAALHRAQRPKTEGVLVTVRGDDLMIRRYERKLGTLFLFVVDASGSMARNRMRAAKGAVVSLLRDAYIHRDQVAVLVARGANAELLVPPTNSVARANALLSLLPTGGGTPLAAALTRAYGIATQDRADHRPVVVIILTDGRANVARDGSHVAEIVDAELAALAARWRSDAIDTVVVDTRPPFDRRDDAVRLASALGAGYQRLPSAGRAR